MENETLATELLHEIKMSAKRWFIAFCVMVVLEVITIVGFMWYLSLPVEEYSIEQDATDRSLNVISGGNYNGGETESQLQTENSSQAQK